jgi:hypothetical protein
MRETDGGGLRGGHEAEVSTCEVVSR